MTRSAGTRESADTRTAVLDSAERLVQTRGFNGFSYADIAAELGITKAALHYHFAGKAELGEAVITRDTCRFVEFLAQIDDGGAAFDRLATYTRLYGDVLRDEGLCLCGMLAAEYGTLPDSMRRAVVRFFDLNHDWLARLLTAGSAEGTIEFEGRAEDAARMVVGTLEGALLVARPYGDARLFGAVVGQLLDGLEGRRSRRARGEGPPRTLPSLNTDVEVENVVC